MNTQEDYGCDPLGDGTYRLVPSGRIVNQEERDAWRKTQPQRPKPKTEIFGMTWDDLERMQGGKLNRKGI